MIASTSLPAFASRMAVAGALALSLAACKPGVDTAQASAPPAATPDPTLVTASQDMRKHLKIEPVAMAAVSDAERIAGRIDFDEHRVARIGSAVTGRITELNASLGQTVRAGDRLAQLHSTELGNSQLLYLRTRAQVELHRRNVERARLLLAADVIGSAELQKRESELAIAGAEMRAAADQLRVQGMGRRAIEALSTSGAINSTSQVIATAGGVVVERNVAQGQVVQPADAMFTVADLSRVWAVAQVPEQQIAGIKAGQSVSIQVPALKNAQFNGKLVYVGDTVNVENRTVTVRTEVDNPERTLKPAMLATMVIRSQPVKRLVVPSSAVVRENGEDHVLMETADNQFRLVKVKLQVEQDGMRPVEAGLKEGQRVVTEGSFHLNNERKRSLAGGDK
jgi:membrane fusion protein, heavy metal efflux system